MSYESDTKDKRNDAIDFLIDGYQDVTWKINPETGEREKVAEFNADENIMAPLHAFQLPVEKFI